jgi:hypothetical protein
MFVLVFIDISFSSLEIKKKKMKDYNSTSSALFLIYAAVDI